ncbi:MAG: 2-dehydropantoate 2-reductase [Anaerolineae bacterium]|nr:MAG: 2-dehydropantoate 2-reductase [Anaerolineae bacterium]
MTPAEPSSLRVLVFGAGAIGTYIGGSLALAGHSVTFIERPEAAGELRKRGLRLDLTLDKRRKARQAYLIEPSAVVIADSLEQALRYGPFDVGIFALKSYDTASALEEMKPHAGRLPPILCLQNGVENEPALAADLGEEKVIAGTVTSAIGRRVVGDITLERLRGVGIAAGHPLSERLVAAFNAAYLNAQAFPNAAAMKWSKMLTNLVANATSAILDMPPSDILLHPGLYRLEMEQLREALAVMEALEIPVVDLPGTPVRALARVARLPGFLRPLVARVLGKGRGGKMPSFHIDLHAGRGKSEVNYLNGAVVRFGEKAGVPTPVNRLLTETLLALTRGEVPLEEYARKPERLLEHLAP